MPMLSPIINTQQQPSAWANFGAGLGQGISGVSQMMVNQKLNDMLEQKQMARQHSQWFNQGEEIAKFEPNKEKRTMIRDTIAAIGPDMYFKLQDHLGTANMENLMSGGVGSGQPTPEPTGMPQGRQMGTQAYDYAPEGPMTATGQGMGQNQPTAAPALRTPAIQQQEMLNAQQTQAANTELMANNVAPNIMGIPKSQKAQAAGPQPQAAGPQPQAGSQEEEQAKNWLRDSSEQEFNQALQSVPQKQRQGYRNYRLALQKEKREAGAQERSLAIKERSQSQRERQEAEAKEAPVKKYMEQEHEAWVQRQQHKINLKNIEKLADQKSHTWWLRTKTEIAKHLGIDEKDVLTATEEKIKKSAADLARGVVPAYKGAGKILEMEFQSYRDTLADLMQTPEGMKAVARYHYTQDEIEDTIYNEESKIEKAYRKEGLPLPENIRSMAIENARPKLNGLFELMHQIMNPNSTPLSQMQGQIKVKRPDGTVGYIPTENLEAALGKGATPAW